MLASEALLLLVAWTRGVPMGQYMAKAEAQRRQLSGIRSADAQSQSQSFPGGRRLSIGPWVGAEVVLRCGGRGGVYCSGEAIVWQGRGSGCQQGEVR